MSDTSAHRVEKITLDQVPAILDQAAAEAWTELTIWGPEFRSIRQRGHTVTNSRTRT